MESKKCSVCGKNLPTTTEYFYKHRNALHAKCIDCYNKYQSKKHSSPEYKEKRAKRLASQREHINKRQRAYWLAHKEQLLKYHRQWAKDNPDVGLASVHRRRARKQGECKWLTKNKRELLIRKNQQRQLLKRSVQ
jgi:hypothetical protein